MDWTPEDMDRLERAIVEGARVQIHRRGTEYVVVPHEILSRGPTESLRGRTSAGDELSFDLGEIDSYRILFP